MTESASAYRHGLFSSSRIGMHVPTYSSVERQLLVVLRSLSMFAPNFRSAAEPQEN